MPGLSRFTALLLAASLGNGAFAAEPAKTRIVASFFPVYCLVANVAGNAATVESLLPGTVGPHDYQFSPRDMRKLAQADVIVLNGLGVDAWLLRAVRALLS